VCVTAKVLKSKRKRTADRETDREGIERERERERKSERERKREGERAQPRTWRALRAIAAVVHDNTRRVLVARGISDQGWPVQ
jgi:hypothetical protein